MRKERKSKEGILFPLLIFFFFLEGLFPPFNNMSLTFLRNYKYFDMNKF